MRRRGLSVTAQQPSEEKLAKLRQALEDYAEGAVRNPLIDHEAEEAKADVRARALRLLDERARSRHELHERLVKLEFAEPVIEDVLDDLTGVGLINDEAFATEWVRQRHARRGKSARALNQELIRKGIAPAIREQALEQIDDDDEEEMAWKLAVKKAKSIKHVPEDRAERDKALRRIVGVLARRGFNGGMSLNLARRALDERCEELGTA
ncbi:recombinase RecX [Corynebacterium ammoniagenes DSM 20306]|nr:recombinase RecX [Corynebacterium ammoniagenes DSM 20306]NMF30925.1 recombination regulator RecX [Corynebacterium ammoniagenes]